MESIIKHPYFIIGVLGGLFFSFIIRFFAKERQKEKHNRIIYNGISATKKMLQSYQEGTLLPLKQIYPSCCDDVAQGRRAWEGCAFWLADVYASYSYSTDTIDLFFGMIAAYWGYGAPYIKLKAYNEILNRSTKYYTDRGLPYHNPNHLDRTLLYQMTQLIVDSYDDRVYRVTYPTTNKQNSNE